MYPRAENPLLLLALGLSYGLLAAGAIALTRLSGGVAMLWLATAPLLAVLAMRPFRSWPQLILAAMIGNILAGILVSPLVAMALPVSIANMIEAGIGAALLKRWRAARSPIGSTRSVASLVLAAGIVAPAVSGALGALIVGPRIGHSILHVWLDWTIGHGMGSLIATPVVLLVLKPRLAGVKLDTHARRFEALGLALFTAMVTGLVFHQNALPLLFLVSLPVLVSTMLLQRLGAVASVAIVAAIGGGLTLLGHGPVMLIHGSEGMRLQFFQLFLAVQFLLALPVASVLSERGALIRALSESEARYRLLAENATDAMLTLDPDGTIRFASAATRELGYFDPASLVGRNAIELVVPEDRERVSATHLAALRRPELAFTVEYRVEKADRSISWFETNTRAIAGDDGEVTSVISVVREIGIRKAREAELTRQATTDPLTGLLNRGVINMHIEAAAKSERPAMLAMFDLDHFKRINDTSGHATGDAVLLAFADLLRDRVRPNDAVGRIGGEEFAVVFDDLTPAQALTACERIRAALAAAPLAMGAEGPLFVTASIGLAELDGNPEEAMRTADAALYRAKGGGRNRVELSEALTAALFNPACR